MSTNIRLKKICQYCKESFIAKTTMTKYCSHRCNSRDYKKQKKEEKLTKAILDTNRELAGNHLESDIPTPVLGSGIDRLNREWLNTADVSLLLGITERTLFRAMKRSGFPKVKIGKRLLFNKQQVMDFLISKSEGL